MLIAAQRFFKSTLHCFYANARSLTPNMDFIKLYTNIERVDHIFITEAIGRRINVHLAFNVCQRVSGKEIEGVV